MPGRAKTHGVKPNDYNEQDCEPSRQAKLVILLGTSNSMYGSLHEYNAKAAWERTRCQTTSAKNSAMVSPGCCRAITHTLRFSGAGSPAQHRHVY